MPAKANTSGTETRPGATNAKLVNPGANPSDESLAQALKEQMERSLTGGGDPGKDPDFDDQEGDDAGGEDAELEKQKDKTSKAKTASRKAKADEAEEGEDDEGDDTDDESEGAGDDEGAGEGDDSADAEDAGEETDDNADQAGEGEGEDEGDDAGEEDEDQEEGEAEDAEDAEDEEDESKRQDNPNWPRSARRRLKKLRAQLAEAKAAAEGGTKQLRAEIVELQEELEAAQSGRPVVKAGGDAAGEALQREIAQREQLVDWLDANPDGGELPDGKGGTVTIDAQQARQVRRGAQRELNQFENQLSQHTQQSQALHRQLNTAAETEYPWLKDKTSDGYQRVSKALKKFPALKGIPGHLGLLADAIEMQKVKAERAKAAKQVKKVVKKPVQKKPLDQKNGHRVPGSGGRPLPKGGKPASGDALKRFMETGDSAAAKSFVESILE